MLKLCLSFCNIIFKYVYLVIVWIFEEGPTLPPLKFCMMVQIWSFGMSHLRTSQWQLANCCRLSMLCSVHVCSPCCITIYISGKVHTLLGFVGNSKFFYILVKILEHTAEMCQVLSVPIFLYGYKNKIEMSRGQDITKDIFKAVKHCPN